jgi:hypothetical protein
MIVLASIYKCGIFSSLFEIIKSLSGTDELRVDLSLYILFKDLIYNQPYTMSFIEHFQSVIKMNQNIIFSLKLKKLLSLIESNKNDIIKAIIFSHIEKIFKFDETEIAILFSQKVDLEIFMEFILNKNHPLFIDRYKLYGYLHYNNYNKKLHNLNEFIQNKKPEIISNHLSKFLHKFYIDYLYEIINSYFNIYLKLLKVEKYENINMDNICQIIVSNFDNSIDSITNILTTSIESYSKVKDF